MDIVKIWSMFCLRVAIMSSMMVIVEILPMRLMMRFFVLGRMLLKCVLLVFEVTSISIIVSIMFTVSNMSIVVITSLVSMDVSWTVFIMVCTLAFVMKICFPVSIRLVLSSMVGVFIDRSEIIVSVSFKMVNNWVLNFMVFLNFMGLLLLLFHQ